MRYLVWIGLVLGSWAAAGCSDNAAPGGGEGKLDGGEGVAFDDGGSAGDDDNGPNPDLPPAKTKAFTSFSSGGAKLSSEHFNLEVFLSPSGPSGEAKSERFKVKLGPAGVRSAP